MLNNFKQACLGQTTTAPAHGMLYFPKSKSSSRQHSPMQQ